MKFLCLCYYDTDAFAKLTAEEAAKIASNGLTFEEYS
jgi:hypothetical protein